MGDGPWVVFFAFASFVIGMYVEYNILDSNHQIRTREETRAAIVRFHTEEASRVNVLVTEAKVK